MLSRQVRVISRRLCSQLNYSHKQDCSTQAVLDYEHRDPAPFFFDKRIQNALKQITRPENERVFRARKLGQQIRRPVYKFMTEKQLEDQIANVDKVAKYKILQMPPVVAPRKDVIQIYSEDPALQGGIECKIVFTDISHGMPSRRRLIAVRELDGTLRSATWEERQRMNQVYAPMEYRELEAPKMFEEVYLNDLLNRQEYEFILDRACIQFDPDDPKYQDVTQKVYNNVNSNMAFNSLRSTRHFGPMVFYLIWTKNVNKLIRELIATKYIKEAILVVEIYYKIYPSNDAITNNLLETGGIDLLECFCKKELSDDSDTNRALQEYKFHHTSQPEL